MQLMKAYALHSAVKYLIKARIPGDIVDCGDGSATTLAVIAASLVALGDTSRRLILFDVTGDPRHRAETELRVWGGNGDLLLELVLPAHRAQSRAPPLPSMLIASGYPAERISLEHYPCGSFDFTAIAFLGLTSETYLANRAAIGTLLPLVPSGGVVAAEADLSKPHRRDAVTDFLNREALNLHLWHVTGTYRIGVKSGQSVQSCQSIAR
jgi:O-methyltransferase